MNEQVLVTLEFDKIIAQLSAVTTTAGGIKMAKELVPMDNIHDIIDAEKETSDALSRVLRKGPLTFSGVKNIRDSFLRLQVGASLGIPELLSVASLLNAASRAVNYGKREENDEFRDAVDKYFDALAPLPSLQKEIERCIISEEDIADDASPGLKSVRRSMHSIEDKIHVQLNSLLVNQRTYLQDAVVTMRNGRYCVPVRSECKGNVPGMVHDQSSTGSTLFIEPMSVVKLNNDLRELELKERKEIEAVLATLSNSCAEFQDELKTDLDLLEKLDFIFAKAMLSKSYRGVEPRLSTKGIIRLKRARHPLLDPKKVVPVDLTLGETFDQLIVTGPNTGGKTVSLKTVGLLTLMGLSGLHIPANEGSTINVFTEVYADIGDKQSIEQSLSTFSSHMTNIVKILDKADNRSLCLFDELCAGTDPTEGAALAMSILTFLHNMKVRTMATTHYPELKLYALSTDHVENACCEFNVETLQPTYRLLIGIPGKSNAFAISQKLGLPAFMIEDARKRLNSEDESFEDVISSLESSRIKMERDLEETEAARKEAEELKKQLAEQKKKFEEQKDNYMRKAREQASQVLQSAKDFADETIRIINKTTDAGGVSRQLEEERTKLRNRLNSVSVPADDLGTKQKKKKALDPTVLKVGDKVRINSMNLTGTVSTLPNAKGDLFVQAGIFRTPVNIKDLDVVHEDTITGENVPKQGPKPRKGMGGASSIGMSKSASISSEVNLIGKTVDEALPVLEKYLDDAYLAHMEKVRVVHGRGTGALRNAVHQRLRKLKYVKSFRLGEFGEGDTGVTIVEFK